MSKRGFWVVWGGVFKNTDFEELEPGTEELHGPFHSEAAANQAWQDEMRRKVDIATHRLFVMRAQPVGG
ncbi:DUF4170 domain-containing protein [Sabulicella glaciei]|uniref:DUF4170 domain-containing protein n=1 Tax=Sabulicella glaciei TaxID=2984948 RepID=A0ABT3NQ12_9PROT|nr:hypothetical protein [Roseococcus sp. MDT2-1-1]MCW8084246.1 hypothetical protein [Roseococcus sp. MDT2-1-1]